MRRRDRGGLMHTVAGHARTWRFQCTILHRLGRVAPGQGPAVTRNRGRQGLSSIRSPKHNMCYCWSTHNNAGREDPARAGRRAHHRRGSVADPALTATRSEAVGGRARGHRPHPAQKYQCDLRRELRRPVARQSTHPGNGHQGDLMRATCATVDELERVRAARVEVARLSTLRYREKLTSEQQAIVKTKIAELVATLPAADPPRGPRTRSTRSGASRTGRSSRTTRSTTHWRQRCARWSAQYGAREALGDRGRPHAGRPDHPRRAREHGSK